ncbi:YveK family protein [Blastococcus tunisiensis]|uniref:Capsular polysaccharide biosynthesis protein n=1 Tax=Blastococcus tunisiensis TaxID=1798228 RepID=A0A1I1XAN6_9ACTN|nr:Wzz/FepE/Etk N-terminal domain-containing protein [Blastococcus sp. DSM 46838]SFE04454.1 Capsular polysaccharide biosynthesis protein [Blastococcus sp. DSM 46838]
MLDTTDDWRANGRRSVVASALWRSRWLIAATMVLAGLGGYLISSLLSPVYTAQARLVLATTQPFDPLARPLNGAPDRYVANQLAVLESRPVLELALQELDGDDRISVEQLADAVTVAAPADTDIIEVRVTGPAPDVAAARAMAVVDGYRAFVLEQVQDSADAAADAVAANPQTVADIRTRAAVFGDGLAVVEEAVVPSSPTSPRPARDALLAVCLAGLVTMAIALVRRDDAVEQEAAAVADGTGVPLLGTAPLAFSRRHGFRPGAAPLDLPVVALDYVVAGRPGAVLVAGLDPATGAGALVLGLAEEAARNRGVVVVDADPERALLRVSGASEPRSLDEPLPDDDHRRLVAPGRPPPGGGARVDVAVLGEGFLHRQGAAEVTRRNLGLLVEHYDLVLVHAAPITSDALAFALVREVGAVVLAIGGRAGLSTDELAAAQDQLALAGRECDGLLLVTRLRGGRRPAAARPPAAPASGRPTAVQQRVPSRR